MQKQLAAIVFNNLTATAKYLVEKPRVDSTGTVLFVRPSAAPPPCCAFQMPSCKSWTLFMRAGVTCHLLCQADCLFTSPVVVADFHCSRFHVLCSEPHAEVPESSHAGTIPSGFDQSPASLSSEVIYESYHMRNIGWVACQLASTCCVCC